MQTRRESAAWNAVALSGIAMVGIVYLADYGLIPVFAAGFVIGCLFTNFALSLAIATGKK